MRARSTSIVVVGAGVHGLSVAYHLSELLEEDGRSGRDVVVLDKGRVGAGASGISGGIVRNFYLSPEINELVRRSVEIFEVDPTLFGFRQVGYVAVVPERQAGELEQIAEQHAAIGYASTLTRGAEHVQRYMRLLFADWRARGVTAALFEERSGWADPRRTMDALAGMARTNGVSILEGVEVVGFETDGGAVSSVITAEGALACDQVIVAPGPWARDFWQMLALPEVTTIGHGDSARVEPTFHYWQVREGEYVHRAAQLDPRAPVVHLDVDVDLESPRGGPPVLESPWGIYFRPGLGSGVACGGLPLPLEPDFELDPYGPSGDDGATDVRFDDGIVAALTWTLGRFDDAEGWTSSSFAAPTCFTPDSYPIVGHVRENVYAMLDSNHGFKLLALGKLAAAEVLGGISTELEPFRVDRFAHSALHPASASPYPWT